MPIIFGERHNALVLTAETYGVRPRFNIKVMEVVKEFRGLYSVYPPMALGAKI